MGTVQVRDCMSDQPVASNKKHMESESHAGEHICVPHSWGN
uniref:Uncharacterized protein n=1 Tax=Anguilla anguilla TaxID=7936 RepID=A0A0E9TCT1_ANGAN